MELDLTRERVEGIVKRKGYAWFEDDTRKYNLNLMGVRTANRKANRFDDWFCRFWKYQGIWHSDVWVWTTDPGEPHLRRPINSLGCAILVPGQYRSTWQIGLHRKSYSALVQRKPVRVFRDDNRNDILDYDPSSIDAGMFGINIHRNVENGSQEVVGKFSAGCQVSKYSRDFYNLMESAEDAAAQFGNWHTYTLLEEQDWKR